MKPTGGSVVVLARSFNPSIFTQLWLVENGIAKKEDFGRVNITTPEVAHHQLGVMEVLVSQDRLQVAFKPDDIQAAERACATVVRIAETLPHTPFRALGINLEYGLPLPDVGQHALLQRMFLGSGCPLGGHFSGDDALFGAYMSKDFRGMRMRLEIKPGPSDCISQPARQLAIRFNFHLDLVGENESVPVDVIKQTMGLWSEYYRESNAMVEAIERYANGSVKP